MTPTIVGAGTGTVLALTLVAFGFWAFLLVALAMVVGALVARLATGTLNARALVDVLRGRQSSS